MLLQSASVVTLTVWGHGSANTEDTNEVAAAISELTKESIGVEVNLVRGQDAEQINLALTSGETIDLLNYTAVSGQLTTLVRNSHATPLDDLVKEYGQGILETVSEADLDTCRINGILYGLPNMKDTSRSAGYIMRQDILDELGIDASTIEDYDDVHDVIVQVHEAYADERAAFPRDWQIRVPRRLFLPYPAHLPKRTG